MAKVKICGITNLSDASLSVELGADALGFNFYQRSPRFIEPSAALEIIDRLPEEVINVGVFVNESLDTILETSGRARIDAIQLHGDESADFVANLRSKTELMLIKAVRVSPNFDRHALRAYDAHAILLDSYSGEVYGGSGDNFDWELAQDAQRSVDRLFLAGGLDPANVRLAIATVQPYAVDVASGVESAPGKKDPKKLEAFIKNAKRG